MFVHIIYLGNIMYDSAKEFYMEIDSTIRSRFIQDLINRWKSARNICYKFGDNVIEVFGDKYGKNIATPSWKAGISMHKKVYLTLRNKQIKTLYYSMLTRSKSIVRLTKFRAIIPY